jgi:predicted metal-dependent enzyme (double-stranded beta helix superfamily)
MEIESHQQQQQQPQIHQKECILSLTDTELPQTATTLSEKSKSIYECNNNPIKKSLLTKGNGIVCIATKLPKTGTGCIIIELSAAEPCLDALRVTIKDDGSVEFEEIQSSDANTTVLIPQPGPYKPTHMVPGLDLQCPKYWISINKHKSVLLYGKGEVRKETALCQIDFSHAKWYKELKEVYITSTIESSHMCVKILPQPVVVDTPLYIVKKSKFTMDMASEVEKYKATVAANLSPECFTLYANIAGMNDLNTKCFPQFIQAIQASLKYADGWCYKKIQEKSNEPDQDPCATYLRITLGENLGNSPGIPYVFEIWPAGHYSPIHNHAGANALIKVIRGSILVELYPYLGEGEVVDPFLKTWFNEGDVTWLAPGMNQTHRVFNPTEDICITLQCYAYDNHDDKHQETFDFVDPKNGKVKKFTPDSDMDFIDFRETMKKEWAQRNADIIKKTQ